MEANPRSHVSKSSAKPFPEEWRLLQHQRGNKLLARGFSLSSSTSAHVQVSTFFLAMKCVSDHTPFVSYKHPFA
uniref:Uncharacterized protein n=1 Tax=Anguilla anguilla TaxID=7936 RepID=A0A0E9VUG5_ANGAN